MPKKTKKRLQEALRRRRRRRKRQFQTGGITTLSNRCWQQKPDVVALQKIYVPEVDFPTDTFAGAGYYAVAHCYPYSRLGRHDYGVAILSWKEPRCVRKGLPGQKDLGARLLTVEVDGLEFSSVYAPAGDRKDIQPKLDWFDSLIAHFIATRSCPAQRMLCGDFNVVPAYRYAPGGPVRNSPNYHEDVQARFEELLDQGSLCDLYARRPPADWADPFICTVREQSLKFTRLECVLGTQGVVDRNPVVEFDIDHAILNNGIFPWVRAPILAHLPD